MKSLLAALLLLSVFNCAGAFGQSGERSLFNLESTIQLPDVNGRIDHLALDLKGMRLFVAALGNDTVEVIDLKTQRPIHTLRGLAAPQGLAYVPSSNVLVVANDKDGSVRMFDASSWAMTHSIPYGEDADNLRFDPNSGELWVGYGAGALGEFDLNGTKTANIELGVHPESFQLEKTGPRIFVNLPDARKIAVIDRKTRTVTETWGTGGPLANFPMALDESEHRLFVVTRLPARLIVLDTDDGKRIAAFSAIGDCDDLFYDAQRRRIYAIGGEGAISVFQQRDADHYEDIGRVDTVSGARTGFFSAELDRLYLAVRKHGAEPAEIRVYRPAP
jgi:hypothetical protein